MKNSAYTVKKTPKPFANTIVKDWYRKDLKQKDEEIYNRTNSCFRALQSNDLRASNYWLTQIEQVILSHLHKNQELVKQQTMTENLVKGLCQYSITTRSEALNKRKEALFTETSKDQQKLREIFSNLHTSDMVSIWIPEFLELDKLYHIQTENTKQLDAKVTVQHMITLNQHNLLEDTQLVSFFKNLEDLDISSYFAKEELILNKFKRPRLLTCFKEIPKYQRHLHLGIIHEIYVNTDHPEEYKRYILGICSNKLREYFNRFQTIFMFHIWSIWEERNYIKLHPSVQLWELRKMVEQPVHDTVRYS